MYICTYIHTHTHTWYTYVALPSFVYGTRHETCKWDMPYLYTFALCSNVYIHKCLHTHSCTYIYECIYIEYTSALYSKTHTCYAQIHICTIFSVHIHINALFHYTSAYTFALYPTIQSHNHTFITRPIQSRDASSIWKMYTHASSIWKTPPPYERRLLHMKDTSSLWKTPPPYEKRLLHMKDVHAHTWSTSTNIYIHITQLPGRANCKNWHSFRRFQWLK